MDKEGDKIRSLKRERGESPAKPGSKDYPDPKQWRKVSGQRG